MYGFHVGCKFYLKIYMLNPAHMQRLADLLRNGTIMGRPFQPYEAHIPYLLQFMADYGLYGCGWVECQIVTFRAPVPLGLDPFQGQSNLWDEFTIPEHLITSSGDKPRLSHCAIEIDLASHHILNRQTIKPRMLHYDFVERRSPIPLEEKLVHRVREREMGMGIDAGEKPKGHVCRSSSGQLELESNFCARTAPIDLNLHIGIRTYSWSRRKEALIVAIT